MTAHGPRARATVSLEGEVVEIVESEGARVARVAVMPHTILDIAADGLQDAHLGDRVTIGVAVTAAAVAHGFDRLDRHGPQAAPGSVARPRRR